MHEALAVAGWLEVGVLLGAGDLDVPHAPPGLVELEVDWVDARVVGSHGVAHVHWDAVLLQRPQTQATGVAHINIQELRPCLKRQTKATTEHKHTAGSAAWVVGWMALSNGRGRVCDVFVMAAAFGLKMKINILFIYLFIFV